MTDYIIALLALAGSATSWYCYRRGRDEGHAKGYADGFADAAKQSGTVSPSAVGGPGAVPR